MCMNMVRHVGKAMRLFMYAAFNMACHKLLDTSCGERLGMIFERTIMLNMMLIPYF